MLGQRLRQICKRNVQRAAEHVGRRMSVQLVNRAALHVGLRHHEAAAQGLENVLKRYVHAALFGADEDENAVVVVNGAVERDGAAQYLVGTGGAAHHADAAVLQGVGQSVEHQLLAVGAGRIEQEADRIAGIRVRPHLPDGVRDRAHVFHGIFVYFADQPGGNAHVAAQGRGVEPLAADALRGEGGVGGGAGRSRAGEKLADGRGKGLQAFAVAEEKHQPRPGVRKRPAGLPDRLQNVVFYAAALQKFHFLCPSGSGKYTLKIQ